MEGSRAEVLIPSLIFCRNFFSQAWHSGAHWPKPDCSSPALPEALKGAWSHEASVLRIFGNSNDLCGAARINGFNHHVNHC
jgi:hypothetical protein